jgi:hypothetical protein
MRIKMKTVILALSLALSATVVAQPGTGSCQQHPDAPYCQGGEGGGGTDSTGGSNTNTNTTEVEITNEVYQGTNVGVESNSNSNSESSSNSSSGSYASGGSVRNSNNLQGGRSDASSTASGGNAAGGAGGSARTGDSTSIVGDTTSNVGDTTSVSEGGKSQASSGGNTQDIKVEGDTLIDSSVLIYEDSENPVASASSVFAGYCQTGMSGQGADFGFSVVNPELFCNHIRIAAVMQEAYVWEMKYGVATCATVENGTGEFKDVCMNETAQIYYSLYTENLLEANELLDNTQAAGTFDAFFGYLIRPITVIGMLIFLL